MAAPVSEDQELKPWEQHSAVIILPRYNYSAPSSLLKSPHSAFLITCPIKREKSATKEAISILQKYMSCQSSDRSERLETCDENSAKKRKTSSEIDAGKLEIAGTNGDDNALHDSTTDELSENACSESLQTVDNTENSLNLSLVKLKRTGLLLFTFPNNDLSKVINAFSDIVQSLGNRTLKTPQWCHRIFPIQQICILEEEVLQVTVSKLILDYFCSDKGKLDKPIKFAVGFNRRGFGELDMKIPKNIDKDTAKPTLLDREKCFETVAGAIIAVAKNAVVDLTSPDVALLVELLPVSGLPHGSLVVGVSVLPHEFITTKPRLCVKPLVADKVANKKG